MKCYCPRMLPWGTPERTCLRLVWNVGGIRLLLGIRIPVRRSTFKGLLAYTYENFFIKTFQNILWNSRRAWLTATNLKQIKLSEHPTHSDNALFATNLNGCVDATLKCNEERWRTTRYLPKSTYLVGYQARWRIMLWRKTQTGSSLEGPRTLSGYTADDAWYQKSERCPYQRSRRYEDNITFTVVFFLSSVLFR